MFRMVVVAAIALEFLACTDVQAKTALSFGYGGTECSQWAKPHSGDLRQHEEDWTLGFISGLASGSGRDALRNTTPDVILGEVDKRCALKPKASIHSVIIDIFEELEK